MERTTDINNNRPHARLSVVECPMCRTVVPVDQLNYFSGRKMCRNCIAGWFDEDDAESDDRRDAS